MYLCNSKICAEVSLKFCQQKTMATSAKVYYDPHNGLIDCTEHYLCVHSDSDIVRQSGSR